MSLHCTHDHNDKSQTANNQSVRYELYQSDIREKRLDVLGQRNNSLMSDDQRFHDAVTRTSLDAFSGDFTQFFSHYINLSTHVKNLNITKCSQFILTFNENKHFHFVYLMYRL